MPEIANPQLVSLCNNRLRAFADLVVRLDADAEIIAGEYNARDLGTIINDAGASNLIADGSATDGRTRRSGGDVFNLVTLIQDFQAFVAATGRRDVLLGWQVNGHTGG